MDSKERRLQERFTLDLKAKLFSETDEEFVKEETIAANISSSGAFVYTKQKLTMASRVHLQFYLTLEDLRKLRFILSMESLRTCKGKEKIWVQATAVVIRIEENGVGLIFDTDYQLTPMKPT
jgi:hypothetical protein